MGSGHLAPVGEVEDLSALAQPVEHHQRPIGILGAGDRLQRDRAGLPGSERRVKLGQPVKDPPRQRLLGLGDVDVDGRLGVPQRLGAASVKPVLAGVLPPRLIEIPRGLQSPGQALGRAGAYRHRALLGRQQLPRALQGGQASRRRVRVGPAGVDLTVEL